MKMINHLVKAFFPPFLTVWHRRHLHHLLSFKQHTGLYYWIIPKNLMDAFELITTHFTFFFIQQQHSYNVSFWLTKTIIWLLLLTWNYMKKTTSSSLLKCLSIWVLHRERAWVHTTAAFLKGTSGTLYKSPSPAYFSLSKICNIIRLIREHYYNMLLKKLE